MDGSDRRPIAEAWHFAGLGLAMFLAVVIAVVLIARSYVTAPAVGDIVALNPRTALSDPLQVSFEAVRLDRPATCLLQTEVMAAAGGSLVVEAMRPGPIYAVHWTGGPTSRGARDCGPAADLALTPRDIAHLAEIAGGRGAAPGGQVRGIDLAALQAIAE